MLIDLHKNLIENYDRKNAIKVNGYFFFVTM